MNTLYFHILRILANNQASKRITALLKEYRTPTAKFKYDQGCLSVKIHPASVGQYDLNVIERKIEDLHQAIQVVLAERQSIFDQLHRERYSTEDSL